ncbi:hypothetical protein ACLB2K_038708 [Fragaria x ananassa]
MTITKTSELSEGRAWAGGEINKSLLTLGCVINAIFEHSGHIPWFQDLDKNLIVFVAEFFKGTASEAHELLVIFHVVFTSKRRLAKQRVRFIVRCLFHVHKYSILF